VSMRCSGRGGYARGVAVGLNPRSRKVRDFRVKNVTSS
jgi:hypothetical protein